MACKIISREKLQNAKQEEFVKNEIRNLSLVKSQNVIQLNKTYKTHSSIYIFTELCNGGDVSSLIESRGSLTESEARLIMRKLVNGLKDLFESDIVHRDLKLPNVLLNFKFKDSLSINGQEYTEFDLLSLSKDEKSLFLATVDL